MSLVSTWCICSDGKWYEQPVWKGYDPDGKTRWFLILDDDDPPEMILRVDDYPEHMPRKERAALYPKLDFIRYTENASGFGGQWRQFGGKFVRSSNRFCEFTMVPPPPQSHDKVSDNRPGYMGCYYDLRKGKHV